MNEEVLKIINEADDPYDSDIDMTGITIADVLEEEEVEFEYLFPEEYAKNMKRSRTRRNTTWMQASSKDADDDASRNYSDFYAKEGIASQTKHVTLNYEDFKEVNYLQDLLKDSKAKELTPTIRDYVFDEKEYPLIQVGSEEYREYDPPEIDVGGKYIARFNQYFDLFSKANEETPVDSKQTMRTMIQYMEEKKPHHAADADPSSLVSLEVLSASSSVQKVSTLDSERVNGVINMESASLSYLQRNAKNFKADGTGLPNTICVTQSAIIVGMSKSQILFFPNEAASNQDSPAYRPSEPVQFGSPSNADEVGGVLSISADWNGSFCVAGYSTGMLEVISVEKKSSLRLISDAHSIAIVFVRVLSSNCVLSVDYDGNVNLTTLTKALFGVSTTTTRILNSEQYGQIVDIAVIPFSITLLTSVRTSSNGGQNPTVTVDLVALCCEKKTVFLAIDKGVSTVLFTVDRMPQEVSERSRYFEAKTKYVQNYVSSAWCRNGNEFQFVQCENDRVGVWAVTTQLDESGHVKYALKSVASYRLGATILSCSILSHNHLFCVTLENQLVILDLATHEVVRTISAKERMRVMFGNVNARVQRIVKGLKVSGAPTPVANAKVYANTSCTWGNRWYLAGMDRIYEVSEISPEARFNAYYEGQDYSNALLVGSRLIFQLQHQLDAAAREQSEVAGDLHIRYYSLINRVSSLVLKVVEDPSIPTDLRVGCAFDVLTRINRSDLLFSSLFGVCEKNPALLAVFFSDLNAYLQGSFIQSIPKTVLEPFLDAFDARPESQRFELEKRLMKLQYTSEIDEIVPVLVSHGYVLAATYMCVNCKGDFVQPIRIIGDLCASGRNLDYFRQYPCVMDETPADGNARLTSLLLFLLHSAVFGVNLVGVSINSIGRISNQEECYDYLVNETPLLHRLLKDHPTFISGLLFFTLCVKMVEGDAPTISIDDSEEEEARKLRAVIEAENYRQLLSTVQAIVAKGLVQCAEATDLSEDVEKVVFYLLMKVACETHVDAMDDDALRAVFAFVADHTEIVQRAQLTTLIENYPISDRIVDSVIASLLSHRCIQECAELLDRNHQFGRILQLYFSGIRTSERMDEIRQLAAKIEKVIATSLQSAEESLPELAGKLEHYYIPLLYLNAPVFACYILYLEQGNFPAILRLLEKDETAAYLFLRQFLLPHTLPALSLPHSLPLSSHFDETVLHRFAQLVQKQNPAEFLPFLTNNAISASLGKAILEEYEQTQPNAPESIGPLCYLHYLAGDLPRCVELLTQAFEKQTFAFQQELKNVFSVKDLERPFRSLRSLSQLLTVFTQLFAATEKEALDSVWREVVSCLTGLISATRNALNLKIDMAGNRKIIAGLDLLERNAARELQRLLDSLQLKIPLPYLLSFVLNQNSGNTIKDVSGIINKVISSLQMDIKSFSNFVRIYRGDYNNCLHQKVDAMKLPLLVRSRTCYNCGNTIADDEEMIVFRCGHVFHRACLKVEYCSVCEEEKNESERKTGIVSIEHKLLQLEGKKEEEVKEVSLKERFNQYRSICKEEKEGSLTSIYCRMNCNKQSFLKLMEPPAMFSSIPQFPDVDPESLLPEPVPGNLPVKPYAKGECVLLMNVSSPLSVCLPSFNVTLRAVVPSFFGREGRS